MTDENKIEEVSEEKTAETTGNATSSERAYSQSELNRMFAERAKQAESALLKRLGFESPDDAEKLLAQVREKQEAEKSELQKTKEIADAKDKQLQALMERQKELVVQSEVAAISNRLGIIDPDAAYRLLDKSSIEYDDDGQAKNIETLLVSMLKERPYLTGKGASAMNPGKARKFSREEIEKMSPAQINENWDAIQDYLSSGK